VVLRDFLRLISTSFDGLNPESDPNGKREGIVVRKEWALISPKKPPKKGQKVARKYNFYPRGIF
jgi:hypothetical protein